MTEAEEHKSIVAYFRARYPKHERALRVSQSGGYRGKGRAGAIRSNIIQSLGGVTGEADIAILLARGGFGCLLIEHKAENGTHTATQAQIDYIEYHNSNGNCAVLTRGVEAAIRAIDGYMAGASRATQ